MAGSGRLLGDVWALIGLVAIGAGLFRSHLMRSTTFVGNSDRLNHFLHGLHYDVRQLHDGIGRSWNPSMFMGFDYFGIPFPFTSPVAYLEAVAPVPNVTALAGYGTCALLIAAAAAAYLYIRQICGQRFAAFAGAALYVLSTFSTVKVSQNDNTFMILVLIPLLMTALIRLSPANAGRSLVALAGLWLAALYFTTLQKVAYVVLLLGAYAVFRAIVRRSWLPVVVTGGAGLLAALGAVPRLVMSFEDFRLVERVTGGVRPGDFKSLYRFQGMFLREGLRWFDDGIFGRFPGEVRAFHNNLNLYEGLLLYTSLFAALLIVLGVCRHRGRWLGLLRFHDPELSFHAWVVAIVMSFVLIRSLRFLLYVAFLRIDFYHGRLSVAALLSQSVVISVLLAHLFPASADGERWRRRAVEGTLGALVALGLLGLVAAAGQPSVAAYFGLTEPVRQGPALRGFAGALPAEIARIAAGTLVFIVVVTTCHLTARGRALGSIAILTLGWLMVSQAFADADFRLNGRHTRTRIPFEDNNSLTAKASEFRTPTAAALAALRTRLDTDAFRSVLICDPARFPAFCSGHLSQFWQLRLLEGYSIGVPGRLAGFPWAEGVKSLRALSFPSPQHLDWPLLAMFNVRHAVRVDNALYRNIGGSRGQDLEPGQLEILTNPVPVTPRQFFTASVVPVATAADAARWLIDRALGPDVAARLRAASVIEGYTGPTTFAGGGTIEAAYRGNRATFSFVPAAQPRLLVVNEMYHARWEATAAGRPLRVYPVNSAMRGVVVPPGVGRVTMRFVPFLYTVPAMACGALALGLTIGGAVWLTRSRRTRS